MPDIDKTAAQYAEDLLEAIQLLINTSVDSLPVDTTEVCRIVDQSDRENGHYRATIDGSVVFDVYSEKTTYRNEDYVIVLFPKNDTQKRTILSRYVEDSVESAHEYVADSEKFIRIYESYIKQDPVSININNNATTIQLVADYEIPNNIYSAPYDSILVEADFQCSLENYNITQGNYGLRIEGYRYDAPGANDELYLSFDYLLDSSQMFGNPYSFIVPFSQNILIPCDNIKDSENDFNVDSDRDGIPDVWGGLGHIRCYLYQTNNFVDANNKEVSGIITVSNLKISFGGNALNYPNRTLKLTSPVSVYNIEADKGDKKSSPITLLWYNRNDSDKYVGFNDGTFNKEEKDLAYKTRAKVISIMETIDSSNKKNTYAYKLENLSNFFYEKEEKEEAQGEGEEPAEPKYQVGDTVYYNIGETNTIDGRVDNPDAVHYWIEWYLTNNNGVLDHAPILDGYTGSKITLNYETSYTQVQVKVIRNGEIFTSNILNFTNELLKHNQNLVSLSGVSAHIKHGYGSQDNYPFYDGTTNQILTQGEALRPRTLEFTYTTRDRYNLPEQFWDGAEIAWIVPKENTMLLPYDKDLNGVTQSLDQQSNGTLSNNTFQYMIKDHYSNADVNNTIICQVSQQIGNVLTTLSAEISFNFSTFGNSGTEYTIIFNEGEEQIDARVVDKEGKTIEDIAVELKSFSGEWQDTPLSLPLYKDPLNCYNLIEAKAQVNGIWIYGYYGLTVSNDSDTKNKYQILAPTSILYDSSGMNPIYSRDKISILKNGDSINFQEIVLRYFEYDSTNGGWPEKNFWHEFKPNQRKEQFEKLNKWAKSQSLPYLNNGNIIAPDMYVDNNESIKTIIQITTTSDIIITAPIYIGINRYESKVLNQWDGSLTIDDEGNYILSAMIGAGRKNSDNSFTGVIMGDYGKLNNINEFEGRTGLFGFTKGARTFELNTEGQFILGGDSVIASPNWFDEENNGAVKTSLGEGESGLILKLEDGIINAKANESNELKFDETGLTVKGKINGGIIHSENWDGTSDSDGAILTHGSKGMAISLKDGFISTQKLIIGNGSTESEKGYTFYLDPLGGFSCASQTGDRGSVFTLSTPREGVQIQSTNHTFESSSTEVPKNSYGYLAMQPQREASIEIRSLPWKEANLLTKWTFSPGDTYYFLTTAPGSEKLNFYSNNTGPYPNWYPVIYKEVTNNKNETSNILITDAKDLPDKDPPIGYFYNPQSSENPKNIFNTTYGTPGIKEVKETSSTTSATGSGLSLLGDDTDRLIISGPSGKYIQLGADSNFALQIGKLKIKWDGTVVEEVENET